MSSKIFLSDFKSTCCGGKVSKEGQCSVCGASTRWTRIAYIAGHYRSKTVRGIVENSRHAERYALKYWKEGFAVICPHLNTHLFAHLFDGALPDQAWLMGDMAFLAKSDLVVMIPGWEKSQGAVQEHDYAHELGKKIVYED